MRGKVVAVLEATKAPGRGLVRAILADRHGGFVARAVTRNLASEEAKILLAEGVEVVAADMNDEASLRHALEGAHAAFYLHTRNEQPVLRFEAPVDAVATARAAKNAGLKHVIWGILEDAGASSALPDEDTTPSFANGAGGGAGPAERKVTIRSGRDTTKPFTALGVPTTFLQTWWHSAVPTGPLAEEIGSCAYGILRRPELIGKTVSISEDLLAAETASLARRRRRGSWKTAHIVGAGAALAAVLVMASVTGSHYLRPRSDRPAIAPTHGSRSTVSVGLSGAPEVPGLQPDRSPVLLQNIMAVDPANSVTTPARRGGLPIRVRQRRGRPESRDWVAPGIAPTPPARSESPRAPALAPAEVRDPPLVAVASPPAPTSPPTVAPAEPRAARAPVQVRPAGFVDPKAVTAVVRAHATEVRTCFDRALMERPDLQGRLVVSATLDSAGRVLSVSPTRTVEGGARLQNCVLTAFQRWTFPPPTGGVAGNISYAFSFE